MKMDVVAFAQLTSNPADPNILIQEIAALLYPIAIGYDVWHDTVRPLLGLLPGTDVDNYEWTNRWDDYINNRMSSTDKTKFLTDLQNLIKYMLALPEYQLT